MLSPMSSDSSLALRGLSKMVITYQTLDTCKVCLFFNIFKGPIGKLKIIQRQPRIDILDLDNIIKT